MLWPQLKYNEKQHALWISKERFCYVPCGRQSGKTELALRRLVRYLPVKRPWSDPRYFYAGPTFAQAKKTAWNRLQQLIPPNWIAPGGISLTDLSIKTIFGSEIFVVGLDKPQRIEGLILDGGIIDENSDIKPKTFDLSILPALLWRNGWVWFIGVPKRFGIGAVEYRERCELAAAGKLPDSAMYAWPSSEIVSPEYLDYCRSIMDEKDFDEQFNAKWVTASGGIFHSFDKQYNVRPCSYVPELPIIISMDFNVNPMCWILGHLKGNILEVFDELWLRNTNTVEALNVITGRYANHKGGFQIYGDASGQSRRTSATKTDYVHITSNDVLKRLGRTLHFDTSNPPIADRFAETNARICDGNGVRHVYIDERCKHLISDLETRTYKPGTRDADDGPDQGHMTDALGYFIHKRFPINLTIPNKQIITIINPR